MPGEGKSVYEDKDHAKQTIAVIGMGYVGLPLALLFVRKGFSVFGVDVDANKISLLQRGESYLPDIIDTELAKANATGRFVPTADYDRIAESNAIIICVPTPLTPYHTPDLVFLQTAAVLVGKHLRQEQLVVLESSTFPGTTREVLKPILEKHSGMAAGIDFYIGYSPERIDPGNQQYQVEQIPKVVSGLTEACAEAVWSLYNQVFNHPVRVSSPEVAEMTKLLENAQRLINISFINEIASICDEMHIDVWEVIDAAKTKPFGFTPYYPGPGIGGHCIPVDPLYLQWKADTFGMVSKFIKLSDEINRSIPVYIANRIIQLLPNRIGRGEQRVLIYGVAYKKDVNDVRESPALDLIDHLQNRQIAVSYHDPYIPSIKVKGQTHHSVELTDEAISQADCVILFTDHSVMPVERIIKHATLVFDTRNATAGHAHDGHIYRLGSGYSQPFNHSPKA